MRRNEKSVVTVTSCFLSGGGMLPIRRAAAVVTSAGPVSPAAGRGRLSAEVPRAFVRERGTLRSGRTV